MPEDSHDDAQALDAAYGSFERSWKSGQRPSIESFLDRAAPHRRGIWLRELLALELELRRESGESPQAAEYLTRFSADAALVQSLFQLPSTIAEATLPGDDGPAPSIRGETPSLGRFGDYVLEREIGRGGMGVVFLAREVSSARRVALKSLMSGHAARRNARHRFLTEAHSASRLSHPNIIPIYSAGQIDSFMYFTMEYIDGPTLGDLIASGPLEPRAAAAVVERIARAVEHAHAEGVLHRDIKPGNVLMQRAPGGSTEDANWPEGDSIADAPFVVLPPSGERFVPRLADFGLAKRIKGGLALTAAGELLGTPGYMAPEQARGDVHHIDCRTDLFALGAVLYACLTGGAPFRGASSTETLLSTIQDRPTPPRSTNPAIDEELERICLTCLEKRPDRRYQTALALATALATYLAR